MSNATCPVCHNEMKPGGGCAALKYDDFADGVARFRIEFGREQRWRDRRLPGAAGGDRPGDARLEAYDDGFDGVVNCPDCNVRHGAMHHVGCDIEECPRCRLQAIGCDCIQHKEPAHEPSA